MKSHGWHVRSTLQLPGCPVPDFLAAELHRGLVVGHRQGILDREVDQLALAWVGASVRDLVQCGVRQKGATSATECVSDATVRGVGVDRVDGECVVGVEREAIFVAHGLMCVDRCGTMSRQCLACASAEFHDGAGRELVGSHMLEPSNVFEDGRNPRALEVQQGDEGVRSVNEQAGEIAEASKASGVVD